MKQMTPVTKEDIKKGLIKLGLKKGDIIGVHSSLSRFGYVIGGADTVIDALLEIAKKAP
jgi:aminoglycoside 3-N-acetyltransferase